MKKTMFIMAIATMFMLSSCGASRKSTVSLQSSQNWQQITQVDASQAGTQQVTVSDVAKQAYDNQAPVSVEMLDYGFGRSGDKAKAMRDALKSAQNNIALRLYRSISSVDTEFAEDISKGENMVTKTKRSDMIVGIVDNKTATISYTRPPIFTRENGVYECEVEVKLTPELLQSITKEIHKSLPADDEMKVKFDEQQYYNDVYQKMLEDYRTRSSKQ